jgi:ubiquinone/menaquinone biosynthesis C-methylase UbiE
MMGKPILDACCGGKMFYFDKQNPLVEFCDIREEEHILCDGRYFEVKPNTVADFTNLPFEDESFNLVVFDPPHLKVVGDNSWLAKKYGKLPKDYQPLLSSGFKECFRVLKTGGTLIFKWNEQDIKVGEILRLTEFKPLFGHKSGKKANTHWIVFYKPVKDGE